MTRTHVRYRDIPKGCARYIYVIRDGGDVAVSYYYHHRRAGYGKAFPEFFSEFMAGTIRFGTWFQHVFEWMRNEEGLDILYLSFEDLLSDMTCCVERVAKFCNVPLSAEDMPRILDRCSFNYMREHEPQLDIATRKIGGLTPDAGFMREGKSHAWHNYFNPAMCQEYEGAFAKRLGASADEWPNVKRYCEFAGQPRPKV